MGNSVKYSNVNTNSKFKVKLNLAEFSNPLVIFELKLGEKKGTLLRISMALCLTPKKPIDRGQINVETFPRYRVQTVEEKRISSKKPFRRFLAGDKIELRL